MHTQSKTNKRMTNFAKVLEGACVHFSYHYDFTGKFKLPLQMNTLQFTQAFGTHSRIYGAFGSGL